MATKLKQPVTLSVIRRGKTYQYHLADKLDWSLMFENAVLEIKAPLGTYYWPIDSVTLWKVEPFQQSGHA